MSQGDAHTPEPEDTGSGAGADPGARSAGDAAHASSSAGSPDPRAGARAYATAQSAAGAAGDPAGAAARAGDPTGAEPPAADAGAGSGEAEPAAAVVDVEPEVAEAGDGLDLTELKARADRADEYLALAQRTQADFENYRKRALREAKTAQERGALKLVHSLLPALDNLDRALAHMDSVSDDANGTATLVAGIRHVQADVLAALGSVGVEPFDPAGETFDPQYHEAVAQQPVEGAQPGTVVEVFQRGYRLGESIVRPARVVVAG